MILRFCVTICVASTMVAQSHFAVARAAQQDSAKSSGTMGSAITGIASTYNPLRPGYRSGGKETASGELYDPSAWTAAIQTGLREKFGGVGYGSNYRPAYALVSSLDKQAIVKINDVGPLKPSRVVDLNEQTMRYFDPDMRRGLIPITVTPLSGDDWLPGPVVDELPVNSVGLGHIRMRLAGLGKVLRICRL
jgi:rare lipoprotein A